jgi:hypothetical protein
MKAGFLSVVNEAASRHTWVTFLGTRALASQAEGRGFESPLARFVSSQRFGKTNSKPNLGARTIIFCISL